MTKSKLFVSAAIIGGMFALVSIPTQAATFSVDCDAAEKIQPVLDGTSSGDTVTVNGFCVEDIVVRTPGLTLEAGPSGGVILGENPDTSSIILVRTRNVNLNNLTVAAGSIGISITRTASATINGGIVALTTNGIVISQASFGRVLSVFITQNETGVIVNQASGADIANSQIIDNTGNGILLTEGSAADIIGNTIQNSGGTGIVVSRSSSGDFANDTSAGNTPNTISGNTTRGILCNGNASVRFDLPQVFGAGNGPTGNENFLAAGGGLCSVFGSAS